MTIFRLMIVLVGSTGIAAPADPRPDEFAYEAPVTLQSDASVYRAPLTAAVYEGVTRSDLGDLRVYNGAGEIAPHGLTRPATEPSKTTMPLPLFPLSLNEDQAANDVSLHVEVAQDGSIVKVRSGNRRVAKEPLYLSDVSRIEQPLTALEMEWEGEGGINVIRMLNVEASDDLKHWQTVGRGALAELTHEGQALERKRVEFPARRVKYLRLTWVDPAAAVELKSVKGEFTSVAEVQRDWVAPGRKAGAAGRPEQRFELSGAMPVDRARMILPANSVARVTVLYRSKDGDPWLRAGEKTVYALDTANGTMQDREMRFTHSVYASQWLLRFGKHPGGAIHEDVGLELGWVPHELIFVARGEGPFNVAYGLAGLRPVDFGMSELLHLTKRESGRLDVGQAVLGTTRELKGESARTAGGLLADWKRWLLWIVLLLGVGGLAILAARLGKRIGGDSSGA